MFPQKITLWLYPLGLFANLFFGTAFCVQWFLIKKRGCSFVPKIFWHLSCSGAVLMICHGFIQSQYPIALLHSFNLIIYFRNLNIASSTPLPISKIVSLLVVSATAITLSFAIGTQYLPHMTWMASPNILHLNLPEANFLWQLIGCIGLTIFSLRFFIQWFYLEYKNQSSLPTPFWKASLVGGSICLIYFLRTGDIVNVLCYGCGLFPSLANLRIASREAIQKPFSCSCFISAGEHSGDTLGGNLLKEIHAKYPDIHCFGVGGPQMRAQNFCTLFSMEKFQISGFWEVLLALPKLWYRRRILYKTILKRNPQAVICIDFPDFHFLLIKKLRSLGYKGKIVHYVCPSIWAWRPSRKTTLEKYLDLLLLILPFEQKLFKDSPLRTVYIGHPLSETIKLFCPKQNWKERLHLPTDKPFVAAFPGSRHSDILRNLTIQVQAFQASDFASTHHLLVSSANPAYDHLILEILQQNRCLHSNIVPSQFRYELMRECDCALAKCGTIVLETALNLTPTIVTCQLRPLDTFLAKYIFNIILPAYSLPNIILGRTIFPEFIGGKKDFRYEDVAAALNILKTSQAQEKQKNACKDVYQAINESASTIKECLPFIFEASY
ncbi:lipid-A-disaccharide synthase [Chlamydia trachomatis]|uniref:Lipid-A-disaccharide synthase n=2 Tax=Chlamydia muridarum TaxID=83560 RepID=LPXB_CHLMU|nr:lipid-A-disaccharide synthase [Chlamydia muridarum]Q9PJY4.1 RecName: Full=Lipid-A-disaccharide synthase [Chlamydia muridarum str. Nigg]UFT34920.1 lipid-A-disaccharide synthase [Chlamydia trachomatis]AAF39508.1 lipid-A-disaccharide synthase, putative [Chlamydia muridarum str. Nigg]AHH23077.1 lipid-A-disaccharide synthase [Chlamydia muridarum str. Nigg3 CMUT3-5]AHH24002.1 lipid-A-disaccharide synthase [Chlamydia muridarum str. Nigg CM972]AID38209.1 lipid-A-disaccharide synthase [Chlamydia mu